MKEMIKGVCTGALIVTGAFLLFTTQEKLGLAIYGAAIGILLSFVLDNIVELAALVKEDRKLAKKLKKERREREEKALLKERVLEIIHEYESEKVEVNNENIQETKDT